MPTFVPRMRIPIPFLGKNDLPVKDKSFRRHRTKLYSRSRTHRIAKCCSSKVPRKSIFCLILARYTTAEQLLPLTFHIFVHVPGLWPFCHPNPAWSKLLAEPRFTHLNFDFKTEMSRYLRIILKEALNK